MFHEFLGDTNLSQAIQQLRSDELLNFATGNPTQVQAADALGCELEPLGISPNVDVSNSPLTMNAANPPTFTFQPAGGTPAFPLNQFDVYFFDPNWKLMASTQNVTLVANGPDGWTWTPKVTDPIWQQLITTMEPDASAPLYFTGRLTVPTRFAANWTLSGLWRCNRWIATTLGFQQQNSGGFAPADPQLLPSH